MQSFCLFIFSTMSLFWVLPNLAFAQNVERADYSHQSSTLSTDAMATYTIPVDTTTQNKADAAVLMIHGWASSMDEVGGMFRELAEQLAEKGIPSLRMNIRGEGAAENYYMTSTFASRVADAESGLAFLNRNHKGPIVVLGSSLGGATALALAGKLPKQISALVLWSSAGDPSAMFNTRLSEEQAKTIAAGKDVILKEWVDITVTPQHVNGMNWPEFFSSLEKFEGSILSIRGSLDYLPRIEPDIFSKTKGKTEVAIYIEGADHIFNVLDPNTSFKTQLLHLSGDWIYRHLENSE